MRVMLSKKHKTPPKKLTVTTSQERWSEWGTCGPPWANAAGRVSAAWWHWELAGGHAEAGGGDPPCSIYLSRRSHWQSTCQWGGSPGPRGRSKHVRWRLATSPPAWQPPLFPPRSTLAPPFPICSPISWCTAAGQASIGSEKLEEASGRHLCGWGAPQTTWQQQQEPGARCSFGIGRRTRSSAPPPCIPLPSQPHCGGARLGGSSIPAWRPGSTDRVCRGPQCTHPRLPARGRSPAGSRAYSTRLD